jgi:hypothetical protein
LDGAYRGLWWCLKLCGVLTETIQPIKGMCSHSKILRVSYFWLLFTYPKSFMSFPFIFVFGLQNCDFLTKTNRHILKLLPNVCQFLEGRSYVNDQFCFFKLTILWQIRFFFPNNLHKNQRSLLIAANSSYNQAI